MNKNLIFLVAFFTMISTIFAFNISLNETNIDNNNIEINKTIMKNESNFTQKIISVNPYKNKEVFEINYRDKKIKPEKGIDKNLKLKTKSLDKGKKVYAMIQFNRNPTKDELKLLQKEGIHLLEYISGNGWYASIKKDLDHIIELDEKNYLRLKSENFNDKYIIRSINEIDKDMKLSKNLRENNIGDWAKDDNGNVYLVVQFHDDVTLDDAEKLMKDKSIEVVSRLETIHALTIKVYGGEN